MRNLKWIADKKRLRHNLTLTTRIFLSKFAKKLYGIGLRTMGTGFIISLIVAAIGMIVIFATLIPFFRKYIVRENGKINYKKTTIYLRWNVFDTVTLLLAIYTIICVQGLNILLSSGETIENPFVQFFTNQAQAWVIVMVVYFVMRISATLKSIKAQFGDVHDDEQ